MKLIYKVICVNDTGKYISCVYRFMYNVSEQTAMQPFLLEYKINKRTIPNIGRIFCFDTLQNAKLFVKQTSNYSAKILEGSYTGRITKIKESCLPNFINFTTSVLAYWKDKKQWLKITTSTDKMPTRYGAISVRDFTPLRIVFEFK